MENNLPESWVTTTLNNICSIETGKWDANHAVIGGEYRFYTCAFEYQFSNTKRFSGDCIILPGNGANVGEVFFYSGEFDAYQRTYILSNFLIDTKYAFYHLKYQWREINKEKQYGSATNFIKMGNFLDYEIPLAPLPEQHRIVAKLDELMEKTERSKKRLEKIPLILKRFRQSVLAAAVSGKLTEEWREKNKLASVTESKEFDKKHFKGNDDLPDEWSWMLVEDYIVNCDKGRIPVSQEERKNKKGKFPYYGATGVIDNIDGFTHDGEFILLSEDGMNLLYRTKPQAYIARGKIWVNNHAHVLKSKNGFENMYAVYCFNTIDLSQYLSGIDQVKLTQKNLNSIPLPIPPKEEQHEIVRRVEALFAFADKIETRYTKAKAQFDKLPQSLLARAFKGELVEQDERDESAEVLLERIKKEKEEAKNKPVNNKFLKNKKH